MSVCGVGFCDIKVGDRRKPDIEYKYWSNMLHRCYSEKFSLQKPTYVGCSVDDRWLTYSNFKKDIREMVGFGNLNWALDKDIIIKGNKVYSRDTCCFVPREINNLIANRRLGRGSLPLGVSFSNRGVMKPYLAKCSVDGRTVNLGAFETPDEAHLTYKKFKESWIREKAIEYQGVIDGRALNSLLNWEIHVDD